MSRHSLLTRRQLLKCSSPSLQTRTARQSEQQSSSPSGVRDQLRGASKFYATDQDLYNLSSVTGTDDDVFEFWVLFDDPKHVKQISLRVDCCAVGAAATDYYSFTWIPKNPIESTVRNPVVDGRTPTKPKSIPPLIRLIEGQAAYQHSRERQGPGAIRRERECPVNNRRRSRPGEWLRLSTTRGSSLGSKHDREGLGDGIFRPRRIHHRRWTSPRWRSRRGGLLSRRRTMTGLIRSCSAGSGRRQVL